MSYIRSYGTQDTTVLYQIGKHLLLFHILCDFDMCIQLLSLFSLLSSACFMFHVFGKETALEDTFSTCSSN